MQSWESSELKGTTFRFVFPKDAICCSVEDERGWAVSSADTRGERARGRPGKGVGMEREWMSSGWVADRRGRDRATAGPPGPLVHTRKRPSFRWRSPHARGMAWPVKHRLGSSPQPPLGQVPVCTGQPVRPHMLAPEEESHWGLVREGNPKAATEVSGLVQQLSR